jgi:hypothetical protein
LVSLSVAGIDCFGVFVGGRIDQAHVVVGGEDIAGYALASAAKEVTVLEASLEFEDNVQGASRYARVGVRKLVNWLLS